jgi:hypothetical protein
MKARKAPGKHYRPARRFYYEIHVGGTRIDGVQYFSGMLEAERVVEDRAQYLREQMNRPLRGYLIMRLGARKQRHRMPM